MKRLQITCSIVTSTSVFFFSMDPGFNAMKNQELHV